MPHVCGLRFGRFAEAMARRGHQIVLLTETFPSETAPVAPSELSEALDQHDWNDPYILACRPAGHRSAERARQGDGASAWRKLMIARYFLTDGGMFADWQAGAAPYVDALARNFAPDLVWATFGNTDSWSIARRLSQRAGCPWIADFKDNWDAFIPAGLRGHLARRFGDAAHMTVLSESHCDQADRWFDSIKTVLYSGVDALRSASGGDGRFRICMAGSAYDQHQLGGLVSGIAAWLGESTGIDAEFVYAGNDRLLVEQATEKLEGLCARKLHDFVDLGTLAELQGGADVNVYVHNDRCIFHHKALELIAAGRPIVAYPGETAETRDMAAEVGASLFVCEKPGQVADALGIVRAGTLPAPPSEGLAAFTWEARARVLESVFQRVAGEAT